MVNQNEDIPGMSFLNSAFDSSTFIHNYMQSFAAAANLAIASNPNTLINNSNYPANLNASVSNLAKNQNSSSPIIASASGSIVIGVNNPLSMGNSFGGLGSGTASAHGNGSIVVAGSVTGSGLGNPNQTASGNGQKGSISTNHMGYNASISSKTVEGKNIWLKHLANAAANATNKRSYCSKTQIYCDAVSRALDIPTCKVVPFFGAFLHDLRFIIESVPSVSFMCNKNIQKPIEVTQIYI